MNRIEYVPDFIDGQLVHKLYIGGVECKLPDIQVGRKLTVKKLTGSLYEFSEVAKYDDFSDCWEVSKSKCLVAGSKRFYEIYKRRPSHVCNYLNGAIYHRLVKPYGKYSAIFRAGRNVLDMRKYGAVVEMFDEMEQAEKDGIRNITPLIAVYRKTPSELKDYFGKGLWKKLCKNSYTRNTLLVKKFREDELKDNLHIPSTILEGRLPVTSFWVWKNYGGTMKESIFKGDWTEMETEKRRAYSLFDDTLRMSRTLGQIFSHDWSARKMEEKHGEYTRIINDRHEANLRERRIRDDEKWKKIYAIQDNFDLKNIVQQTEWEIHGVKAKLLTTKKQVSDEGCTMHHCVYMHSDMVVEGKYAVVHLSGEEETTLGLHIKIVGNVMVYEVDQHYGVCNKFVESESQVKAAQEVVLQLNALKVTKESYDNEVTRASALLP